MWTMRPNMLAILTKLMYIEQKYKQTQVEKYAFDGIKRIVAFDPLLNYPDFNETFKICNDAIAFQLRAVVHQKVKLIAFYSRKLTDAQKMYTVIQRELLSILESLKYFGTILLGQKLIIYTN